MMVTIITVHPSVTVVQAGDRNFELPTDSFPVPPQSGQVWELTLQHRPTNVEQLADLNDLLSDQ